MILMFNSADHPLQKQNKSWRVTVDFTNSTKSQPLCPWLCQISSLCQNTSVRFRLHLSICSQRDQPAAERDGWQSLEICVLISQGKSRQSQFTVKGKKRRVSLSLPLWPSAHFASNMHQKQLTLIHAYIYTYVRLNIHINTYIQAFYFQAKYACPALASGKYYL